MRGVGGDELEAERAKSVLAGASMVGSCEQATHSGGCGFCSGFGTTLRSGRSKYLP